MSLSSLSFIIIIIANCCVFVSLCVHQKTKREQARAAQLDQKRDEEHRIPASKALARRWFMNNKLIGVVRPCTVVHRDHFDSNNLDFKSMVKSFTMHCRTFPTAKHCAAVAMDTTNEGKEFDLIKANITVPSEPQHPSTGMRIALPWDAIQHPATVPQLMEPKSTPTPTPSTHNPTKTPESKAKPTRNDNDHLEEVERMLLDLGNAEDDTNMVTPDKHGGKAGGAGDTHEDDDDDTQSEGEFSKALAKTSRNLFGDGERDEKLDKDIVGLLAAANFTATHQRVHTTSACYDERLKKLPVISSMSTPCGKSVLATPLLKCSKVSSPIGSGDITSFKDSKVLGAVVANYKLKSSWFVAFVRCWDDPDSGSTVLFEDDKPFCCCKTSRVTNTEETTGDLFDKLMHMAEAFMSGRKGIRNFTKWNDDQVPKLGGDNCKRDHQDNDVEKSDGALQAELKALRKKVKDAEKAASKATEAKNQAKTTLVKARDRANSDKAKLKEKMDALQNKLDDATKALAKANKDKSRRNCPKDPQRMQGNHRKKWFVKCIGKDGQKAKKMIGPITRKKLAKLTKQRRWIPSGVKMAKKKKGPWTDAHPNNDNTRDAEKSTQLPPSAGTPLVPPLNANLQAQSHGPDNPVPGSFARQPAAANAAPHGLNHPSVPTNGSTTGTPHPSMTNSPAHFRRAPSIDPASFTIPPRSAAYGEHMQLHPDGRMRGTKRQREEDGTPMHQLHRSLPLAVELIRHGFAGQWHHRACHENRSSVVHTAMHVCMHMHA